MPQFRSLDDPETLRRMVQRSGQGLYITTPEGAIVDANPAFRELVGASSLEELCRQDARALFADPAQRDLQMALLERNGEVRDFELRIIRPDGELRTVVDSAWTCRDPATGETFIHGSLVDVTKQRALEVQLVDLSTRDPLTGCYNRRFLGELEARLVANETRSWGCIYMDIDRFKEYNDKFGHQEGDAILIRMSRFLLRQVRADEQVIRLGGDEFLVVLSGTDAATTEKVARRLQLAAASGAPVPFSLGWAAREGDEHLEKTIDRADRNLLAVRVVERTDRRD